MSKMLISQDQGTKEDAHGRRNKQRPEDLRSGTLHGQYNLRGSILVIKDNLNPVSGFLSFGTDISTAPQTAGTGSGLFIDYTGLGLLNSNTLLVRVGNLNGTYGYVTDVYGFATGQYGAAGKVSITIEQTNGIRFINNTDVVAKWDLSGNITVGKDTGTEPNVYIAAAGALYQRVGTTNITTLNSAGIATNRAFGHAPVSVALIDPTIDLDDGGNIATGTLLTSYIHITSAASDFTIRGICAPTIPGHRLVIHNHSTRKMTIQDNGTPSSGAYQNIRTSSGLPDIYSSSGGLCEFIYNNVDSRWDVLSVSPGWTT